MTLERRQRICRAKIRGMKRVARFSGMYQDEGG